MKHPKLKFDLGQTPFGLVLGEQIDCTLEQLQSWGVISKASQVGLSEKRFREAFSVRGLYKMEISGLVVCEKTSSSPQPFLQLRDCRTSVLATYGECIERLAKSWLDEYYEVATPSWIREQAEEFLASFQSKKKQRKRSKEG